MKRFNDWLALKVISLVGSMWCAYFFCLIALISLPSVLQTSNVALIVAWFAQTFIQLVLLSIIIVGQNIQSATSEEKLDKILNRLIEYQKEELQELKDDKEILQRELLILQETGGLTKPNNQVNV